jgi:hypothetical protein
MTMTAALFGRGRGTALRAAQHPSAERLAPAQVASLGILLVAAQLPQAVYLPAWIGALGIALVLLRFALLRKRGVNSALPAGSGAAQRQAWGERIRGEGPPRDANSAALGGSAPAQRQAWGDHIPAWALAAIAVAIAFLIRRQFCYFVGRDPCVAFLYVLIGF